jgi:hypothetical protein
MGANVLEEAPLGAGLDEDAAEVRPQPSRVLDPEAPAGVALALTRVAARDDIHDATPRAAVEGGNIVPDRRAIQGRAFHPCHESGRRVGFPLDVTHSSMAGLGDV